MKHYLKTTTDFNIEQYEKTKDVNNTSYYMVKSSNYMESTLNYALFVKQVPQLWMFVASKLIDGVWVPLEKPLHIELYEGDTYDADVLEYQEAQSKVLFDGFESTPCYYGDIKGFELINNEIGFVLNYEKENFIVDQSGEVINTLEDLSKYKITLSDKAVKELKL